MKSGISVADEYKLPFRDESTKKTAPNLINAKLEERKRLICLFNSYINISGRDVRLMGMSGGDVRFIEIFKRIKYIDKVIVTSLIGRRICEHNKLKAPFIITTKELQAKNILFTDFVRIIKTLFLKVKIRDNDIIYSTSEFFMDTFPAFVWKLRNRKAKWIVCVFLLVPNLFKDYSKTFSKTNSYSMPSINRLLFFLSQELTLFLGKRWVDQILVLNKMDKEYLVKNRGIAESTISVVNGGVDYNHLKSLIGEKTTYDGVFLGRFHPQKGIFDLIRIWKLVCDKKPEARLCIIGGGSPLFIEKVKAVIKENNLCDNIELVGSKLGDEKFLLLKSGGIFLCPSFYESFAIVVAEAMACGLPVVAYNLPIFNDIYGENILRVPLGDINKFADAVINFLNNDELRRSFGLKGQKFVQKYDWNEIAEKELQLIIGLLNKA